MSHYLAQTDNPVGSSVLFIDTNASNPALLVCADQRIRAVKNLLQCLSLITAAGTDPHVLSGVCEASALLLQEGCDLLGVLTLREDTVH